MSELTFIENNGNVTPHEVWRYITQVDPGHRSIAKANGDVRFRSTGNWVVLSPMGMWSSNDEYGESCRRMSAHFRTRVIVIGTHSGLSGGLFGLFSDGRLIRVISNFDGEWGETSGTPQEWEAAILGGIPEENRALDFSEGSLAKISRYFGLPDTKPIMSSETTWATDRKVALVGPPPLP